MKIAPAILCSVVLCLAYANTAQSFVLTKKLVAVKQPIFAAKVQLAKDVKDKVVAVATKVSGWICVDILHTLEPELRDAYAGAYFSYQTQDAAKC